MVSALAGLFAACAYDPYKTDIPKTEEKLTLSASAESVVITEEGLSDVLLTYTWTPARSLPDEYLITYTAELDVVGNNFGTETVISSVSGGLDFEYDGVSYYIHPASGDGTLKDGQADPVVMDDTATPWKITEAGNYRVIVNMEKREVTIYSAATDLQPKSVTFYPNGDETKEQTTVVVTDFWRYGDDAWKPGKKMNCTQSLADPQVFVYEGNLKDRVSFRITSEYTVGEDQYTIDNAYAYTCPLTDTGAKQEISITLDKECKLHGGCDNPTRNSYYRFNDGKYRVIINLRTETILATAIE